MPLCSNDEFVNDEMRCVNKNICQSSLYCQNEGNGAFSEALNGCFCNGISSQPEDYCDIDCQNEALKVFLTKDGTI